MEQVCRVLEVSRSGYYGWKAEKTCRRRLQNQALRRRLIELHEKYPALGLDSLYRLLKPEFGCSRKRVHRQMRLAGISSVRRMAYKTTTHSNHSHPIAPNLLQRNFSFDRPDQAWVGDITYIPTGEGWLYLAIVKDLCTRKIVGYAFSDKIDTRLTLAALDMAYRRRKPAQGLIFHSDRGVQYAHSDRGVQYARPGLPGAPGSVGCSSRASMSGSLLMKLIPPVTKEGLFWV